MTIRPYARYAALPISLAFMLGHAGAQNFERVAPKELPATPPAPPVVPPAGKAAVHNPDQVVTGSLRGLVFVPSRDAVKANGTNQAGVVAADVPMLNDPGFTAQVTPYLGKPLTFGQLHEITQDVVAFYRAHGLPVVKAIVPQQDIQNGTIQIVVLEFKVGTVSVAGNEWFSAEQVEAPFTVHHGDEIKSDDIADALEAANANPFRRVELVFKPSPDVGYSDLVLQTHDRFPLRIYGSYDNSGTPILGRDRWAIGFNWGNALWADQQFSYQLTTSDDFWHSRPATPSRSDRPSFVSHSVVWSTPLPWGDRAIVFGAYEETAPELASSFNLLGKSGQASFRYDHRLKRCHGISGDVQIGYDFKTTNNNLDFGGTQVSHTETEIDQFLVSYTGARPDAWGSTEADLTLVFSPGGLTANNNTAAFQPGIGKAGRNGAKAHYVYFRPEIDRTVLLPAGMSWHGRVIGQLSSEPLLDTEQLSLGGPELLRGYDPNTINGDEGVVLSNEIRSPAFTNFPYLPDAAAQVLAFWDYADLSNKDPGLGDASGAHGSSVGMGLRFNVAAYAIMKLDYGWQLQRQPGTGSRGEFGFFSLVLGY